jgi:hypothetical protein
VLAPKNVQSMRTLFNIAHRLSNVLGPAWALVLETMNTLDKILHSPRTTTQAGRARLTGPQSLRACLRAGEPAAAGSSGSVPRRPHLPASLPEAAAPACRGGGDAEQRRCRGVKISGAFPFPVAPGWLQEVSAQSGEPAMSSDLAILAAAASQLFECSSGMSREAVVALLSGLRDVSVRNVPGAGAPLGQAPRLYALNRMVEVLLHNIARIFDLWAIFLRCACV